MLDASGGHRASAKRAFRPDMAMMSSPRCWTRPTTGHRYLREIDLGILEPSGQFSFLQRKGDDAHNSPPQKHKA